MRKKTKEKFSDYEKRISNLEKSKEKTEIDKAIDNLNENIKENCQKLVNDSIFKRKRREKVTSVFVYIALSFVVLICAVCIVISTCSFTSNQKSRSNAFDTTCSDVSNFVTKVGNMLDSYKEDPDLKNTKEVSSELQLNINQSIEYIERLQKTQEESSKNDVMSFVFSMLSSVLVGLCAAFVGKSYNNLHETKNVSEEAKDIAREARKDSEKVSEIVSEVYEDARNAKIFAEEAKENAEQTKENAEKVAEKAEFVERSYKKQVAYQQNALNTQSILIKIAYAKFELIDFNKIDAGDHFKIIKEKIIEVNENYDNNLVEQLHNELCNLREYIEKYNDEDYVKEGLSKRIKDCDEGDIASFKTAIENYCNTIEEAMNRCEEILYNHTEDLI